MKKKNEPDPRDVIVSSLIIELSVPTTKGKCHFIEVGRPETYDLTKRMLQEDLVRLFTIWKVDHKSLYDLEKHGYKLREIESDIRIEFKPDESSEKETS